MACLVVLASAEARRPFKRVALLYDNVNAATTGEGQVFRDTAQRMGHNDVTTETFPSGTTQFAARLDAIRAARPDANLVAALAQVAVFILQQRLQAGILASMTIIGANGLNRPAIIRGAGRAAEGVIVGNAHNPEGTSARNQHFRAAFYTLYTWSRTPSALRATTASIPSPRRCGTLTGLAIDGRCAQL